MEYQIKQEYYKIKDLPLSQQPREKLRNFGPDALSNHELLAIILNNGTKNEDIVSLSKRILDDYGQIEIINCRNINSIQKNFKLPFVKACQIVAVLELGKRLFGKENENNIILNAPAKVYEHVKDMTQLKKEVVRGLYLNVRNKLIHDEIISMGNLIENVIVPQLIFHPAINYYAQGIIIVHNHPSHDPTPSQEDITMTKSLVEAGKILKIPIIDHIIVVKNNYFSFHENNMLD